MSEKITGKESSIVPLEAIERRIFLVRGMKVMLDADLAEFYGVPVKVLMQSIKRNHYRFPSDFMFQLSKDEFANLRSQFVTSSWGGRRYLPYVFTVQNKYINTMYSILGRLITEPAKPKGPIGFAKP